MVELTDSTIAHARSLLGPCARPTSEELGCDSINVFKSSGHLVIAVSFVKRTRRTKSWQTHRTYLLLDFRFSHRS